MFNHKLDDTEAKLHSWRQKSTNDLENHYFYAWEICNERETKRNEVQKRYMLLVYPPISTIV